MHEALLLVTVLRDAGRVGCECVRLWAENRERRCASRRTDVARYKQLRVAGFVAMAARRGGQSADTPLTLGCMPVDGILGVTHHLARIVSKHAIPPLC